MSEQPTHGGLARLRRERPGLFAAGQVAIVGIIVAAVVFADPIPALISAIPFPDLDLPAFPDMPDVPGWVKRVKNGVIIGLIVLAVIGGILESQRTHDEAPEAPESPDR